MMNHKISAEFELVEEAFKWFEMFECNNWRREKKVEPDMFYDAMCRVADVSVCSYVFSLLLVASAWEWGCQFERDSR